MIYRTFSTTDAIWCSNHCNKWSPFHPSTPSHASSSPMSEAAPSVRGWMPVGSQFCHRMQKCGLPWPMLSSSKNNLVQLIHLNTHSSWCRRVENQVRCLFPLCRNGDGKNSADCAGFHTSRAPYSMFTIQIGCDLIHGRNTR